MLNLPKHWATRAWKGLSVSNPGTLILNISRRHSKRGSLPISFSGCNFISTARKLNLVQSKHNQTDELEVVVTNTKSKQLSPSPSPSDYRELGLQQELFFISKYSPGSPIFLPNGTRIFNRLVEFLRAQYENFGFDEVLSPVIYKSSLWKTSGHWDNYAEDMYAVTGHGASKKQEGEQERQNEDYGLKPMNCPGHCLIFASKARSYRDLPLRYADFSPLHRNEVAGALSGLTRVRCFHQDDGHIFCRPSQIKEEIRRSLELVRLTYSVLGLGPYRLVLSTRPQDNFIGTLDEWNNAESALTESLQDSGLDWTVNEGDGAFYGPKIDIIIKDKSFKEHQTATIQLDFQLPKRFELQYQAPAPEFEQNGKVCTDPRFLNIEGPVTPVLIHRAILGSVERIMALLIEQYNGHWPFWLNPRQAAIITINDSPEVLEYARQAKRIIQGLGASDSDQAKRRSERGIEIGRNSISVDIFDRAVGVRHKIAAVKRQRYGLIILVGPRDIQNKTISVDFSGVPNRNRVTEEILRRVLLQAKQYVPGKNMEFEVFETCTENLEPNYKDTDINIEARTQVQLPANWLRVVVNELQTSYS